MAEKFASQDEFNKRVNPYGPTTMFVRAADTATFGYLPTLLNKVTGIPEEAARKIVDAASEENPTWSKVGTGLGYGYDAALAAAGAGALASAAGPSAAAVRLGLAAPTAATKATTVGQMLGPAALRANLGQIARTTGGMAKAAWKPLSTLGAVTGGGAIANSMFGADTVSQRGEEPAPAPADKAPAAAAPAKQPDWYDQVSAASGVDRGIIESMVRRNGGISISALQALRGMQPKPPTAQQRAMSLVEQSLGQALMQAQQSGDVEQERKVRATIAANMADIAGAEPMSSALLQELLGGTE